MLAYVPAVFALLGLAAYTVLAGADFGAGLWTLLSRSPDLRSHARHAMGPVWEANHVWLIFVLVVTWTSYPVAFGSIASTLAVPLLIAAIGIVFRGAAYALRGLVSESRPVENLFALSSILTPFALGTAIGAIAVGRVPVGNAAGNLITSWLNPPCVLIGVLAVAFSGYLAAVYLAADSRRLDERALEDSFRTRALASGLVSGALALAGLIVMRPSLDLTHGAPLVAVCVSGVFGLVTTVLCWRRSFGLARATAALAVASVVAGWALAQEPRLLPGLSVTQAAAGRSTLIAIVIGVAVGLVILIPSLILLFTLLLRGRLYTPDEETAPTGPATAGSPVLDSTAAPDRRAAPEGRAGAGRERRAWAFSAICLVAGTGLLVFGAPVWTLGAGVACLIACAVTAFGLTATPAGPPPASPPPSPPRDRG